MTDPLDDFLRAYDAWAASPELCAGPLFDRMLEARGAIDGVQREAGQKNTKFEGWTHPGAHGTPQEDDDLTMKTYRGDRDRLGTCTVTVDGRPLPPRLDVRNHSPTGFEWGYGGSGPAQLALAILCDHLGDDESAEGLYQAFKRHVIAGLPEGPWTLTTEDVDRVLAEIQVELHPPVRSPAGGGLL